jgi:signal transduction histidine kinase
VTTARFPRQVPHKYLLHAPTLLPLTPWTVVLAALGSTPQFDLAIFGTWLVIHATTLAIAAGAGLTFSAALKKLGRNLLPLGWVFATGALIGLVKALGTLVAEATFLDATAPTEALLARGIGGVVVGMWVVTLVAYGKTALVSLGEARETLIRQNVAHRLAEEAVVTPPEVTRSLKAVSDLRDAMMVSPDKVSAEEVRDVVDSTIRPLSRAMWSVETKRYPDLQLLSLYRIMLRSTKIRALRIALVWALTSFTAIVVALGVIPAATYSLVGGAVAFAAFSLVRLGWTMSVVGSLVVVSLASLGSVAMAHFALVTIFATQNNASSAVLLLASAVWMVFVALGSSVVSGVTELRELIRDDLASNSTQNLIDQRAKEGASNASTKLFATKLHGSVQSTLLGLANALERKEISPDEVQSRIAEISEQLDGLIRGTDLSSTASPQTNMLEQLLGSWQGLMEVTVDEESVKILSTIGESGTEAHDILREALTNAHRHGKAQNVQILAETNPAGHVTLTVTDDGYGPRRGQPGLGSTLLDVWTHGRWSLRPGPEGGSVLVATLSPAGARD